MALTIILMAGFSVFIFVRNYKSLYGALFAAMGIGMAILITSVVIEAHRVSTYSVSYGTMYSRVDAWFILLLNRHLRLSLGRLTLLRNTGALIFLAANLLFARQFRKCARHGGDRLRGAALAEAGFLVYYAAFFLFFHPVAGYRLFLAQFGGGRLFAPLCAAYALFMGLAVVSLAYPLLFLLYQYHKGRLTLFGEQLASMVAALCALDVMFCCFFLRETPARAVTQLLQTGLWRGLGTAPVPRFYMSALPFAILVGLLVVAYLLVRYQTLNIADFFSRRSIRKNLRGLYANLRDVLHSEKNTIFNMKILAADALEGYGTEEGRQTLARLLELSDLTLKTLNQSINEMKDFKIRAINQDFALAVDAALERFRPGEGVAVVKAFCNERVTCNYDLYHMTQLITNLLENAADSLRGREAPRIAVTLDLSDKWVYFAVTDNGGGIPKESLKQIFKPYFSTKSRQNNWGIGMTYVQRVVKAHLGHIRVKSKEGEGTAVELLLTRG